VVAPPKRHHGHATQRDPITFRIQPTPRSIDRHPVRDSMAVRQRKHAVPTGDGENTEVCRRSANAISPARRAPGVARKAIGIARPPFQQLRSPPRSLTMHRATRAPGEDIKGLRLWPSSSSPIVLPEGFGTRAVDLAHAMEATAIYGTDSTTSPSGSATGRPSSCQLYRTRQKVIYADVKALYDLRSRLVHGAANQGEE